MTGQGIAALLQQISASLNKRVARDGVIVRWRHLQALQAADVALGAAIEKLADPVYVAELVAADIRTAMQALDVLIGKVDVEDLLGDIFASFCIGKLECFT